MFNNTLTIIGFTFAWATAWATSLAYGLELNPDPTISFLLIFIGLSIWLLWFYLDRLDFIKFCEEKEEQDDRKYVKMVRKLSFYKDLLEKQKETIINQSEELDWFAEKVVELEEKIASQNILTKKWYNSAMHYKTKSIKLKNKKWNK